MAPRDPTRASDGRRWVIVGAAAIVATLIVVMLGIVPTLVWPGGSIDEGSCEVTAAGREHRDESLRLGVPVPPDQRPDAEVGDRYTSMDGCVPGDDALVR